MTTSPLFFGNRYLTFSGFNFRNSEQAFNDCTLAAREAMLQAMDYLTNFGYRGEQAYILLGVAPIELRISGITDVRNACVTLYMPLDIFNQGILPRE